MPRRSDHLPEHLHGMPSQMPTVRTVYVNWPCQRHRHLSCLTDETVTTGCRRVLMSTPDAYSVQHGDCLTGAKA